MGKSYVSSLPPAWADSHHESLLDTFYPSATSLPEALEQIRLLKSELVDKQREVELYLHVAARSTEAVDEASTGHLAAEVRELRERVRAMPAPPLALLPPPPGGYPDSKGPASEPAAEPAAEPATAAA